MSRTQSDRSSGLNRTGLLGRNRTQSEGLNRTDLLRDLCGTRQTICRTCVRRPPGFRRDTTEIVGLQCSARSSKLLLLPVLRCLHPVTAAPDSIGQTQSDRPSEGLMWDETDHLQDVCASASRFPQGYNRNRWPSVFCAVFEFPAAACSAVPAPGNSRPWGDSGCHRDCGRAPWEDHGSGLEISLDGCGQPAALPE
jgi:hypothetical protein